MIPVNKDVSRKNYSKAEDDLITSALIYSIENGINKSELSELLELILGRSKAGIMFRLYKLGKDLKDVPFTNGEKIEKEVEKTTEEIPIQVLKSETQIINSHMPSMDLEEFSLDDVGKRVKVKAFNLKPYGVFCVSKEGKTGLLLQSMVSTDYVYNITDYVNLGDEFWVKVDQDRKNPERTILNAKVLGNIIAISERNK